MGDPNSISWEEGAPAPATQAPAYTLFDSMSVGLATLLGSPIAGALLMGVNYRRLGKGGQAVGAVAIAVVVTVLAVVFGNFIPVTFSTAIGIGLLLATKSLAQVLQGPDVTQHVSVGGKLGSRWTATGNGVAMLAVVLGAIALFIYAQEVLSYGTKMTFGSKDAIYYSGSATAAEASIVGGKLKNIGYFSDHGVNVFLSRDKNGPVVSFVVKDGAWNKPDKVIAFEEIGANLAPLLHAAPLRVRMIDTSREIKEDLTAGKAIIGTKDEIYYFGSATEADARALGRALKTAGFFLDRGFSVFLSKGEGTVLSLVVREGIWDQPDSVTAYENLARQVAPAVGGLPITLRLINTELAIKKEIPLQN
jgi:hypothetical protein